MSSTAQDAVRDTIYRAALALDAQQWNDWLALCDEDSRLGYLFLRRIAAVMAERLSATRMRLMEAYGGHLHLLPVDGGVLAVGDTCCDGDHGHD